MAREVCVFSENKKGQLKKIIEVVSNRGINLRAFTITGDEKFGIVKMIVNRPDEALEAYKEKGFSVALKDVVAVLMKDRPGGLLEVLNFVERCDINIIDSYGFVVKDKKDAVLIIEVDEYEKLKDELEKGGFKILTDREIDTLEF